nr:phage tail tape measure protein [uncultured Cohaesibacter sp.]
MSTREIETKLTVQGVDKLTGSLGKMSGAAGKFVTKTKRELGQLQKLRGPVKLIEDFRKAESQLGKSATTMKAARKRAKELGQAFKNATRPTAKMRVELERTQSAARKAPSKFKANSGALKTAGIHTGLGVLSVLKNPVDEAKNFEEEMVAVGAVTRTLRDKKKFGQLRDQALRLGETTSFTNVDAASAQRFLSIAGMSVSDILSSMPSVLNLSKAGRIDLAGTADIASNIMSGYGMTGKDMGRISDVLVGTFNRSKVNVKQISETLEYVGPKAKAAGLELEYVAAATGKLGDAGIQGSMAGAALNTVISRLSGPPKMAKKALARLGVETKDLNGNLRPFEELLDEIADKMKDLGSAEQIELTKKIAGEEGSRAFTVLLEQRAHIKKLRDELKAAKGEAKEMASIMGDNAAGDEKVLEAAWSAFKTEIGTQLLPYYRELLQTTTELINAGREWVKANPELTKTIAVLAGAVGSLLVFGGGAAFAFAGVVGSFTLLKATLKAGGLVRALGSFGSALDDYSTKADNVTTKNGRLWRSFKGLLKKGGSALLSRGGLATVGALALPLALYSAGRKDAERAKADPDAWLSKFNGMKPQDDVERAILWQHSQRIGSGFAPSNELTKARERLHFYRNADPETRAKFAENAKQTIASMKAALDAAATDVHASPLPSALNEQATGVRSSPLTQALAEKAAQIRSVNVSGGAASKPVDGQRTVGGPGYAGASYQVNEDGTEVATFAKNGRVLSRKDSMAAVAGQRGGGDVFAPQIHISGGGMDPSAIAQAVRAELERLWHDQKMSSFHNSEFA